MTAVPRRRMRLSLRLYADYVERCAVEAGVAPLRDLCPRVPRPGFAVDVCQLIEPYLRTRWEVEAVPINEGLVESKGAPLHSGLVDVAGNLLYFQPWRLHYFAYHAQVNTVENFYILSSSNLEEGAGQLVVPIPSREGLVALVAVSLTLSLVLRQSVVRTAFCWLDQWLLGRSRGGNCFLLALFALTSRFLSTSYHSSVKTGLLVRRRLPFADSAQLADLVQSKRLTFVTCYPEKVFFRRLEAPITQAEKRLAAAVRENPPLRPDFCDETEDLTNKLASIVMEEPALIFPVMGGHVVAKGLLNIVDEDLTNANYLVTNITYSQTTAEFVEEVVKLLIGFRRQLLKVRAKYSNEPTELVGQAESRALGTERLGPLAPALLGFFAAALLSFFLELMLASGLAKRSVVFSQIFTAA